MATATAAVAEEAATNLEEVAGVVRKINPNTFGIFTAGTAFGLAIGFYFGHKVLREKIRAEAFAESEEEVARIRDAYMAREKPATAEEIVREKGYAVDEGAPGPVPGVLAREMAEQGKDVSEIAQELGVSENTVRVMLRPLTSPVPIQATSTASIESLKTPFTESPAIKHKGWDYKAELAGRSPDAPYVIHHDEYHSTTDGQSRDDYQQVIMTYYAGDDVLVDGATNQPLPHADLIVGENNLQFGHGSDDEDVVYVRNEEKKLEMEICRTQDRYDVIVLGIDPDEAD